MAATEDRLVAAIRTKTAERRGQRQRLFWLAGAAASYGADTVFLGLFCAAGTLPASVAVSYGAAAAVLSSVIYVATATGWNLRLRDPGMVLGQCIVAVLMQFAVAFAAPQIAFPWLANLFTVFAFSMVWLSVAASVAIWALCASLGAALFYGLAGRLGLPDSTPAEITVAWLFFSLVLGRCVFLSVYSTSMRKRLGESRRKLAQSLEQIQDLVAFDELTKAFNRRSMMARLEQERGSAARTGAPLSVAMIDLDHFKSINDAHGHATGDEVLKAFVRTVHATMRDTDVFGRYGGEEFLMILTDTGLDGAARATERVRLAVAASDWTQIAPGASLTASIGVAAWKAGEEITQLLGRADAALYRAKHNGRNRVERA